jgi:GH18 family chitinase
MIPHDLHNRLSFLRSNSPVTLTNANTAQVGQIIDMVDLMSLEFVIAAGALTDAGMTLTPLVEEGDDAALSDAAAVADADLLGTEALATFTQADDDTVKTVGYVGTKRYVRLTLTPAGNDAGSATFGATAIGIKRFRGTGN